jgi:hypothetical protein
MIEEGAKLEKLTKKEQEELVTIGKVYRVIASYLLQKIQTKREKYSVKKKQSSKRRKGYYLKKVSE